ncbi:hypothetical protein Dcar01_01501 [Deinococcus carri]|uniref:Uncharacterized protein n=1 Tax=Deinococcus carri TaxID=1211323 RepID=A0ABP9W5Y6_9DEIO
MRKSLLLLAALGLTQAAARPITLQTPRGTVALEPSTLRVELRQGARQVLLAQGTSPNTIQALQTSATSSTWRWPERHLVIKASVQNGTLQVRVRAEQPTTLRWPILPFQDQQALILPQGSGRFIPLNRPDLLADIDGLNTTEDLNMPFVALKGVQGIQTWHLGTPFHNTLKLQPARLALQHEFLNRQGPEEQTYELTLTPGKTPIEPALVFRASLQRSGHFRSFADKVRTSPDAEKLKGALFAYLWGSGVIGTQDVRPDGWTRLLRGLTTSTPGQSLLKLMDADTRNQLQQAASSGEMNAYVRRTLVEGINQATTRGPYVNRSAAACLTALQRLFPGVFVPGTSGGQGASLALLDDLKAAGIDRARLAVQDASDTARHPDVVQRARALGYLMGPYDSYESVHPRSWAGSDRTWPTAQLPAPAYEEGGIMNKQGQYVTGFQGVGRTLNAAYAFPFFQKRVQQNLAAAPYNYYFLDVDATANVQEDYNPRHPSSMAEQVEARRKRLKGLSDRHLVVGSEGGSYLFADLIHVGEGYLTPALGRWVDPDLADKKSPYFLGRYYPAAQPDVFFKSVPLKPSLMDRYGNAAFQLPLYEAALHDSVINTNHWLTSANKFSNLKAAMRARSFLYLEPLQFHISRDSFPQDRAEIVAYSRRFSPLHRTYGTAPLSDFQWLTGDRQVQRSVFQAGRKRLTVVANFRSAPFVYQGHTIAPQDVLTIEDVR